MTIPVNVPVRTTTKIDLTPTNSICLKIRRSFSGGRTIHIKTERKRIRSLPISSMLSRMALPKLSTVAAILFIKHRRPLYSGPFFSECASKDNCIILLISSACVIPEAAAWWKSTVEGVIPGRLFGSSTTIRPSPGTNISILA